MSTGYYTMLFGGFDCSLPHFGAKKSPRNSIRGEIKSSSVLKGLEQSYYYVEIVNQTVTFR